jgi:hypothetical protein
MEDMLFTVAETAKILKTNIDQVNLLRRSGLIKFMKLGCYKVRKQELERFLEESQGLDVTNPDKVSKLYRS